MIYAVCLLAGALIGAAASYIVLARLSASRSRPAPLEGVRWERVGTGGVPDAVRHMRRHYPTHELVIGCPFSDLVEARGPAASAVKNRCGGWNVGVAMVDRRTGALSRIVLWGCDPHLEEKTWILRRAGYRVTVVDRHIEESGLVEAMAA